MFFSCSKEELSNDSTSSQKTDQKSSETNDLTQIITDQKGTKIYRQFHSIEHKKDYESFLVGELSVQEILNKYPPKETRRMSTEDWNTILRGEREISSENDGMETSQGYLANKPNQDQKLTKLFRQNSSPFEEHPRIRVNFIGNWWWGHNDANMELTLRASDGSVNYVDKEIDPNTSNYKFSYQLATIAAYNIERINLKYRWSGIRLLSIYQAAIPDKIQELTYDFHAWFKFFWIERYVVSKIVVN